MSIFHNDPSQENNWRGDPEDPDNYIEEDTIVTEKDIKDLSEGAMVTLAEIENANRIADLACDIEDAINGGAGVERFKTLKSNSVFAGSMLTRAFEEDLFKEDVVIKLGKNVNRCKRLCDKYIEKV